MDVSSLDRRGQSSRNVKELVHRPCARSSGGSGLELKSCYFGSGALSIYECVCVSGVGGTFVGKGIYI